MLANRALILLILLCSSPALKAHLLTTVDDENCSPVTAEKTGGVWEFVNCGGANCSPGSPCALGSTSGGGTVSYNCGCFADGEPECCHIVLVSINGGPKLPQATGNCSTQQAGCPAGNTCKMIGGGSNDSTAARNCKNVSPPPH